MFSWFHQTRNLENRFAIDSSDSCAIHFMRGNFDSRPRSFSSMCVVAIRVCPPPYFALSTGFANGIMRGSRCSISLSMISDTRLRTSTMISRGQCCDTQSRSVYWLLPLSNGSAQGRRLPLAFSASSYDRCSQLLSFDIGVVRW